MTDIPDLEPMSDEEMLRIKAQIEKRWREKPHYGFDAAPDPMGSPACVMRAHEVLRLIARAMKTNS